MDQQSNTIYALSNVSKTREKGGSVFRLDVERFHVNRGDFVAIVGESGCGKSTLLDMLGLVLSPSSADTFSIQAGDTNDTFDIADAVESQLADIRKSHIGYVLQTGGLLPFLTVRENIELPCVINGRQNYRKKVDDLADALKIDSQMEKKPQFLSGGQRQRVAIARALSHSPPIVLADEPTAAVDKYTALDIMEEFRKLTGELGVTLLMVTHDTNLVAGIANRTFGFQLEKDTQHPLSKCVEIDPQDQFHDAGGKK